MPSVVSDFEYDIFISYRHKDNEYDGWVTGFVDNLKKELRATFKEDISIYFDTNPHDGLLETHNVDKSLEGKLKCLLFIPIISQTYCDPKSFAWQHELCAFNKMAKDDGFGRDIKLSNGNVASRILPVKIHDLDADDETLLESELGSVLRAIEFIFKSPGVNRPLTSTDKRDENSNKTFYRDQVNKAANAIKEIIVALKHFQTSDKERVTQGPAIPSRSVNISGGRRKAVLVGIVSLLAVTTLYFLYRSKAEQGLMEKADRSVAVLAFSDLSPGHDQEWFSDGLTEEIINSLANMHELKVLARISSFYFKGKDVPLQEIADKLGVAHLVEGSVTRIDNRLRITAQLIRAKDGFHIWSQTYDRSSEDLFEVQTDIAKNISRALLRELTPEKEARLKNQRPLNPEAYEAFLQGRFHRLKQTREDFDLAERYFQRALEIDPNYALAVAGLADVWLIRADAGFYPPSEVFPKGKVLLAKALELDDSLADVHVSAGNFKSSNLWDWSGAEREFKRAIDLNPNLADAHFFYADLLLILKRPDEWNREMQRALELDPLDDFKKSFYGWHMNYLHRYDEAIPIFQKLLATGPNKGSNYLGLWGSYYRKEMYNEALSAAKDYFTAISDYEFADALGTGPGEAAYRAGMKRAGEVMVKQSQQRHVPRIRIARMFAHAGDNDSALAWLEKAYQNRESPLVRLAIFWDWDDLRVDPRFQALLRRMNLPGK